MSKTELLQKVQFVNSSCTASEAIEVISKVIDDQIKFCKIQNPSEWIKDNDCDQNPMNAKIKSLTQRKQELIELTKKAQATGAKLNLCGDFQISLEK